MTHLALVGPTASGKSALALALALAESLGDVEIVSLDSMQIYRGMDVGTAKPSRGERARVRHHLVDVAEPTETWTVARFQAATREAIADVEARGRRALLVGGTGLYLSAVVDGLSIPPEDPAVRRRLEAAVAAPDGLARAYRRLEERDPVAAARIEPRNRRRVVRALEVIELTGRPFSASGPGIGASRGTAFAVRLAGVWLPRGVVAARIEARVAGMRAAGFEEEVRALEERGGLSPTAEVAIGYRELRRALREGRSPDENVYERIAARTRALARRQRMWFRRDRRIRWFATAAEPERLLDAILACWKA